MRALYNPLKGTYSLIPYLGGGRGVGGRDAKKGLGRFRFRGLGV